jgi:hypothetical protein
MAFAEDPETGEINSAAMPDATEFSPEGYIRFCRVQGIMIDLDRDEIIPKTKPHYLP